MSSASLTSSSINIPQATLIDVGVLHFEDTLVATLHYLHYGYLPQWSIEDDVLIEFVHYLSIFEDAIEHGLHGLAESAIKALDKDIYMSHDGPGNASEVVDETYEMQSWVLGKHGNLDGLAEKFKKTVLCRQAEKIIQALDREELKELGAKFPGFLLDLTDGLREKTAAEKAIAKDD